MNTDAAPAPTETARCPGCGHACCPTPGLECGGESDQVAHCGWSWLCAAPAPSCECPTDDYCPRCHPRWHARLAARAFAAPAPTDNQSGEVSS